MKIVKKESLRRLSLLILFVLMNSCGGSENTPALTFIGTPPPEVDHNRSYHYAIRVNSDDPDISVEVVRLPDWMSLDADTNILSGIAGRIAINQIYEISLNVSQGNVITELSFTVQVNLGEIVCDQDFGDPVSSAYILPFPSGRTYKLSQSYCPSNPAWGHNNWFAYDFDTQTGDTIIASRDGQVIAVRENNPDVPDCSGGKENFVFILHADGTVMQYVHLTTQGALVENGDRVVQGQEIGISGNSGCSAGPHVHVALFRDRTNYDRQSTLPFNYSNADGPLDNNRGLLQSGRFTAL